MDNPDEREDFNEGWPAPREEPDEEPSHAPIPKDEDDGADT